MTQYHSLGSQQVKVLRYVAEENPSSINQVAKATKGSYKNVYDIFKKFIRDNYLEEHKGEGYYPTERGVNLALLNEADPAKIRKKAALFFEDIQLEKILFACDVVEHPALGIEILKIFNINTNSMAITGKASLVSLPLLVNGLDDFLTLLKKYPGLYNHTFDVLKKALDYYVEA